MSKTPVDQSLETIFHGNNTYVIPTYQRKYAWGREQAIELFDDILNSDSAKGSFLGTMIFEETEGQTEVKVVDGQQRLTTLTLLLIAIRHQAYHLGKISEDAKSMCSSIGNFIVFKHNVTGKAKGYRLKPSQKISAIFNHLANPDWDSKTEEERFPEKINLQGAVRPIKRQVKKVRPIFEYFLSRIKGMDAAALSNYSEKVLASFFYIFRVSNSEESMELFERTNARGMRLEVSDLIKTELFSQEIPGIEQKWEAIEDIAGESPTRLLKYFYYTQGGHVTKKDLFKKTKKLPCTAQERLDRICDFADFFRLAEVKNGTDASLSELKAFLEKKGAEWLYQNEAKLLELHSAIIALSSFTLSQQIPLCYGVITAAISISKSGTQVFSKLLNLMGNLESFHFINTVICNKAGNEIETLYADYAMKFTALSYDETKGLGDFIILCEGLTVEIRSMHASMDTFMSAFAELDYEDDDDKLPIFYSFDRLNNKGTSFSRDRTKIYRPFEDKIRRKLYSLDHIYPQSGKDAGSFQRMHCIGNLVVLSTGDNSSMLAKSPDEKLRILRDDPAFSATRANLKIIPELIDFYHLKAGVWDDSTILERSNVMARSLYTEVCILKPYR